MDFAGVLAFLNVQYPGQLVFYVDDIAKMLGKSAKALSELIGRDSLPFQVKYVGGLRCVDVFQVAQWLASNQEMAMQSVSVEGSPILPEVKSRPVRPTRLPTLQGPAPKVEAPVLTGNFAARILKMRHDHANGMARFVNGLRKIDEVVFMNEVMEKLFYTTDLLSSSYVVTIKKLARKGAKVLAQESRNYFGNQEHAEDFLMVKLNTWRHSKGTSRNKLVEHIVLESSGETLFHAIVISGKPALVSNSISLELNGL